MALFARQCNWSFEWREQYLGAVPLLQCLDKPQVLASPAFQYAELSEEPMFIKFPEQDIESLVYQQHVDDL